MLVRGLELNVVTTGSAAPTARGLPLIWAHGLLGSTAVDDRLGWFGWDAWPADSGLVRYDARGHGGSQASLHPDDYTSRNLGLDLAALADALGAREFVAGGWCMGAASALHAALWAPGDIRGLVLAAPPTAWETRDPQAAHYRRWAWVARLGGGRLLSWILAGQLDRWLPPWWVRAEPRTAGAVWSGVPRMGRRVLWNALRGAANSDLPQRQAFQTLDDVPALILGWSGCPAHPVETAAELHRLLPRSELCIANDAAALGAWPERIRAFVSRVT